MLVIIDPFWCFFFIFCVPMMCVCQRERLEGDGQERTSTQGVCESRYDTHCSTEKEKRPTWVSVLPFTLFKTKSLCFFFAASQTCTPPPPLLRHHRQALGGSGRLKFRYTYVHSTLPSELSAQSLFLIKKSTVAPYVFQSISTISNAKNGNLVTFWRSIIGGTNQSIFHSQNLLGINTHK